MTKVRRGVREHEAENDLRIALVTEGTYPTAHGGVSVWCDQLISGLPEYRFDVHAIVATQSVESVWKPPANLTEITFTPLWGPARSKRPTGTDARSFNQAFANLLRAIFRPGEDDLPLFLCSLKPLSRLAQRGQLSRLLTTQTSIDRLLREWASYPLPGRHVRPDQQLPRASVNDAATALTLLDHFLRPLGAPIPDADLCHTVSNGLTSLIALNAKWTNQVPFLLTEHGIYLRERYLEFAGSQYAFAVRAFAMRFFRLLTAATYLEADYITPGSDYNRRWQVRHGAAPTRVRPVYNGIDPEAFPSADEPAGPVLSWVGRIAPIKDVESLITAFGLVIGEIPNAKLRLFGSAPPGNEGYLKRCQHLVDQLGIEHAVTFEGRVESIVEAYHAGNVVVLSSASEGFPYTVIEAMASGRATVSTDVGGVREAVDDTGLVVPPRDPTELAAACVRLLREHDLRAQMAAAARARAQANFTLEQFLNIYRSLYPAVAAGEIADIQGDPNLPLLRTAEDTAARTTVDDDRAEPFADRPAEVIMG